jgi:hypothetical protein
VKLKFAQTIHWADSPVIEFRITGREEQA